MAVTSGNIHRRFADFFRMRQKQSPERKNKFRLGPQKGWLEEIRAEAFSTSDYGEVSVKEGGLWSRLSAKIYIIESIGFLSVVLAYYDDDTILWLDDHSSNSDFGVFVKNERLWTLLPERREDLIALLIATKLNYFGLPQLISAASDIPSLSEEGLEIWSRNPQAQNQLAEAQQRLEQVSEKIAPPNMLAGQNQAFELDFFIWTKIIGRVIRARFVFGQDGYFLYEDNELAQFVGRYLVPR